MSYSIIHQAPTAIVTDFPRRYYLKAGFYMFFGWFWAGVVLWFCLIVAFFLLLALGVISTGFLHGMGGHF